VLAFAAYKCLKTALRTEIDQDACATLYSDASRPLCSAGERTQCDEGINQFGDEVRKAFMV